ncbi:MAG TPA: hypothetical protein VF306_22995, partial [Pirellulales bacterium]
LHHRRRALNDFAGGDLVGNVLGKDVYAGHWKAFSVGSSLFVLRDSFFANTKTNRGISRRYAD